MPEIVTVPTRPRVPWNRGRIVGPKPPLKPKHVCALRTRLQLADHTRDLALFNLAVDSKLRGCDLVGLSTDDIYLGDAVRLRATVCQRKTGRPVPFEITEPTRESLAAWLTALRLKAGDWLFPSRSRLGDHLSTRHYSRLIDCWVVLIDLDPSALGTYCLRRTKVSVIGPSPSRGLCAHRRCQNVSRTPVPSLRALFIMLNLMAFPVRASSGSIKVKTFPPLRWGNKHSFGPWGNLSKVGPIFSIALWCPRTGVQAWASNIFYIDKRYIVSRPQNCEPVFLGFM